MALGPFSDDQVCQIYDIFGIPQSGSAISVGYIISLYGPARNVYDFSAIVSDLNGILAAVTTAQYNRIAPLLTEWDTILGFSEMQIYSADTQGGVIVHHQRRLNNIRKRLGGIIGFGVPDGGFWVESQAITPGRASGGNFSGRVMR